jgi:hypothetical protein
MNITNLIAAVILEESGGDNLAVGRRGELGPMQVRQCAIDDVNRRCGTTYRLIDMTNRAKAADVFVKYIHIYSTNPTEEVACRIWNGGPRGPRRNSTKPYWRRIQRRLNQQRHEH